MRTSVSSKWREESGPLQREDGISGQVCAKSFSLERASHIAFFALIGENQNECAVGIGEGDVFDTGKRRAAGNDARSALHCFRVVRESPVLAAASQLPVP
jgi:hypothetical protein